MTGVALTILLPCVLGLGGCANPRNLPGFRGLAERQGQEAQRHTEETLRRSPVMQELDRFCREQVPLPDGFVFLSKHASYPERTFLTYFYSSGADYQKVRSFYAGHFGQDGWQLTDKSDKVWGPKSLEFRKDRHLIIIYHKGMGEKADYAVHCERLPE